MCGKRTHPAVKHVFGRTGCIWQRLLPSLWNFQLLKQLSQRLLSMCAFCGCEQRQETKRKWQLPTVQEIDPIKHWLVSWLGDRKSSKHLVEADRSKLDPTHGTALHPLGSMKRGFPITPVRLDTFHGEGTFVSCPHGGVPDSLMWWEVQEWKSISRGNSSLCFHKTGTEVLLQHILASVYWYSALYSAASTQA